MRANPYVLYHGVFGAMASAAGANPPRRQTRRAVCRRLAALLAMMLAVPAAAHAEQLGIYEFTGTSTGDGQFNMVSSPAPGGGFSYFYRNGVEWAAAANVFNSQGWSTNEVIAGMVGFEFHANPTHSATITGLSFDQRGSNTVANQYLVAYSTNGDDYSVLLYDDVALTTTNVSITLDPEEAITLAPDQWIEFIWGVGGVVQADGDGTPESSGTFRLDNVALHGQLSPIPEPASLVLVFCGAAALAAVSWARRRARRR